MKSDSLMSSRIIRWYTVMHVRVAGRKKESYKMREIHSQLYCRRVWSLQFGPPDSLLTAMRWRALRGGHKKESWGFLKLSYIFLANINSTNRQNSVCGKPLRFHPFNQLIYSTPCVPMLWQENIVQRQMCMRTVSIGEERLGFFANGGVV